MIEPLTDAALLARLVAFDTTSTNSNLPIADFICDYLDSVPSEVIRNYNDDCTKVNLVIRAGDRTDSGLGLCLSGHLDTVPATEPDWIGSPFLLAESDDRFVGRGACDMKGFVALAVNTVRRADVSRLRHPLVLVLTFDEEPGILGARHLVRSWQHPFVLPKATIVGEPTELRVVRMHKGHLKMRATLRGKSAHTAYAHLGVNAIELAAEIIRVLAQLRDELRQVRSPTSKHFSDSPAPSLTITRIHGGTATNVVPDRCVLDFGLRLLPDMSSTECEARVRSVITPVGLSPEVEVTGLSPPFLTGEDSLLYRELCSMLSQTETFAVSYASDAGPLQELGLECVLFGPGSIEVAHQPNEWLPKNEFTAARGILDRLVERFCQS